MAKATLALNSDGVVTNSAAVQVAPSAAATANYYMITNTSNSAIHCEANISGAYTNGSIYGHGNHQAGGLDRGWFDNLVTSSGSAANISSGWLQPGESIIFQATLTLATSRFQIGNADIRVKHNSVGAVGDFIWVVNQGT